jgi:hypothetical protein
VLNGWLPLHRSKNWYYVHLSSKVAAMKTILLSSAAIVLAVAIVTTAARDTAHAASRFDRSWTVQITTRRGACDPSSSFGVEIHDGVVSGAASGRVLGTVLAEDDALTTITCEARVMPPTGLMSGMKLKL